MRRARYLAGDDSSIETSSALLCLCCPAILTTTCAPAWQAGLSTDSWMAHQMSSRRDHDESQTNAMLSTAREAPDYSRQDKSGSPVESQVIDMAFVQPCRSVGERAAIEHFVSRHNGSFGTDRSVAQRREGSAMSRRPSSGDSARPTKPRQSSCLQHHEQGADGV